MWLNFWLNNFHFALEFSGGIICFSLAWLAFDAFIIKREFKVLARSLGFFLVALWLIVNSLSITQDFILFFAIISYLSGLFFILFNLHSEKPAARPKFEMVLVLPAVASILWQVDILATILFALITLVAYQRYREELLKNLEPFLFAFFILTLASIFAVLNTKGEAWTISHILEHVLKLGGFGFLAYWGWQYLKMRLKEELLLVFVGMALIISVIITFTFSAILLKNMEDETAANLISNVKVLDYSLGRMKNETLANAQVFAENKELREFLVSKNFTQLEKTARDLMIEKSMSFLTIADADGEVVLRAHWVTAKGDNVKDEKAGKEALAGKSYVTIEPTETEKFSIRGAVPIRDFKNNLIGAVITGFIIDNAFADQIKKATGLEAVIYKGDAVQATTILDPGGKTRNVGVKQTDQKVIQKVLSDGQGTVARTTIFSRPYLAAFLPLVNAEGEIIGMLQTSRLLTEITRTAADVSRLTLFVTIIIAIMVLMPAYLAAKKISEEV